MSFLLTLTFKTLETQGNSFCPESHFNGMLGCSDREATGRSRPKFDCCFPSETAGAMPEVDRGKEHNETRAWCLEEMSLRGAWTYQRQIPWAQVWRDLQPLQHSSCFQPGLNFWDKIISQHGSIQAAYHRLCLECCPFLFTYLNSVLDTKSAKLFNLVPCQLQYSVKRIYFLIKHHTCFLQPSLFFLTYRLS